jgi:uncharacterized protein
MMEKEIIHVEIAYLSEHQQNLISLQTPKNTTLIEAIQRTQLLQQFPEIDLSKNKVGIFGKIVSLETLLNEGDRVEIYRPLLMDPKEKRVTKVKKRFN